MSVSCKDAQAVLAAILHTFRAYVCPGHTSPDPDDLDVICDGSCMLAAALKPSKTWAEIDATPTLYGHDHEDLPVGSWSIAWEGGAPDEWTYDMSGKLADRVREATGGRVFIEPINNCILGVYPA